MKAIPENKTVLCERIVEPKSQTAIGGIFYEKDMLPIYRITDAACGVSIWKRGDFIICDSTGTKLNVPGHGIRYLFKEENIACKILDACIQKGNKDHGK